MSDNTINPAQLEQLLTYASRRLGSTPEQLKAAFEKGGLGGLSSALSAEQAAQAEEIIRNKEKAAQLLNDPQIRKLLETIFNNS